MILKRVKPQFARMALLKSACHLRQLTGHSEFMETPVGCITPSKCVTSSWWGLGRTFELFLKTWCLRRRFSFFPRTGRGGRGCILNCSFSVQSAQKCEGCNFKSQATQTPVCMISFVQKNEPGQWIIYGPANFHRSKRRSNI